MGKIRWYKRDPDAALAGMMCLSLEERGAYNTVLDLIYSQGGEVLDDERFIAGWLRCDIRVWKRIRKRLLDLGKLYLAGDALRNSRADRESTEALHRVVSAAEAGRSSGRKRNAEANENNELARTTVELRARALQPQPDKKERKKESESSSKRLETHASEQAAPIGAESEIRQKPKPNGHGPYTDQFEELWQRYPRRVGKALAAKAYAAASKRAQHGEIMTGLKRAIGQWHQERREPQFVPHPASWLNGDRWLDEPPDLLAEDPHPITSGYGYGIIA